MASDLKPLRKDELEIGKPLPWPVYNQHRKLLLREGFIIQTRNQVETLISEGLFRDPYWTPKRSVAPVVKEEPEPEKKETTLNTTFANTGFSGGESLQMSSLSDPGARYYVKYIGCLEKQSIIVTTPVVDGGALLMKEGQIYTFRAFSGKNIYSFNGGILRSCHAPYPYLHISYPSSVQAVPVRKAQRIKTNLIVSMLPENADENTKPKAGMISDLSPHGAQVDTPLELGELADKLKLSFRLKATELDVYLSLNATIRSIRKDEAGTPRLNHYGIEFNDLTQHDGVFVRNFIYQKMIGSLE
jgi:c-di-GMP-binding flagellar brake protein YcgR